MGPRIGSLFSGYGGLDLGVMDALGGEVVWHCETDPAARRVLEHRWPGVPNLGDVTTVDWLRVPAVDVLVGGFPCQDVSAAGRRAGMVPGTRSGLWAHMAYAIGRLRPRLVVIENVRGLLTARGAPPTPELLAAWAARDKAVRVLRLLESKLDRAHREGKTAYVHRHSRDRVRIMGRHRQAVAAAKRADAVIVRAIGVVLGDLADLGFDARWCGLRAADVGAPHGRYRIFIVAWPAGDADCRDRHGRSSAGLPGQAGFASGSAAYAEVVGRDRARGARDGWAGSADRGEPAADTPGDGRDEGGAESAGQFWGLDAAADGDSAGRGPGRRVGGRAGQAAERDHPPAVAWGDYTPAIRRWELILGRLAPAPTQPGKRGGEQLSPRFVEWMMGLPEGWVTAVPGLSRGDMLRLLGNGVVPQQASAGLGWLLAVGEVPGAA